MILLIDLYTPYQLELLSCKQLKIRSDESVPKISVIKFQIFGTLRAPPGKLAADWRQT